MGSYVLFNNYIDG